MKDYKQWIAKYEVLDDYDMESFIRMRILIAHTGINHNGSKFTLESFESAKGTLANKPLLARVVQVGENQYDFNGHDMDWEIDEDGNFKVVYLEQPIGVIPETHDYEIVEYDGREYVAATGYVWREYSNLAEQIIEQRGEVEVSMEIAFGDEDYHYDEEDGTYQINNFKYRGVTLLGAHVAPGMEKAHATAVFTRKSDEAITTEYTRMIDKLKEELDAMFSDNGDEDDKGGEAEVNVWEEAFKKIFNVESLEEFNHESVKVLTVEEFSEMESKITEFQQTITELESKVSELEEYKANREKEDFESQRQAIIDEYTSLIGKADVEALAKDHTDLQQLEFTLAKAYVEKAKNAAPRVKGVKINSDNLFERKSTSKKRVIAL